jgi:hypothetical protein
MNHGQAFPVHYVRGGRVRPYQRPPAPPKHQPYQPSTKPVLKDTDTVHVSASRLLRWHNELQGLEQVRNAIKSLSMNDHEKTRLLSYTTQVKLTLRSVKGEMRDKLRA